MKADPQESLLDGIATEGQERQETLIGLSDAHDSFESIGLKARYSPKINR
ncbi:hypothetical protein [Rhodococcus qingshengii]